MSDVEIKYYGKELKLILLLRPLGTIESETSALKNNDIALTINDSIFTSSNKIGQHRSAAMSDIIVLPSFLPADNDSSFRRNTRRNYDSPSPALSIRQRVERSWHQLPVIKKPFEVYFKYLEDFVS